MIPQDVIDVIPDVSRGSVFCPSTRWPTTFLEIVINRVLQTVAMLQVNAVPQQEHSVVLVMRAAGAASGR